MGKMKKTALKKKGALTPHTQKKNEGRPKGAMKEPPLKKKGHWKKKWRAEPFKNRKKKGALHSNKPNSQRDM